MSQFTNESLELISVDNKKRKRLYHIDEDSYDNDTIKLVSVDNKMRTRVYHIDKDSYDNTICNSNKKKKRHCRIKQEKNSKNPFDDYYDSSSLSESEKYYDFDSGIDVELLDLELSDLRLEIMSNESNSPTYDNDRWWDYVWEEMNSDCEEKQLFQ